MSGARLIGRIAGLEQQLRPGVGPFSMRKLVAFATDAIKTITVSDLASGILQVTGLTAGRVFTTPTAAAIIAAYPEMDIGDAIEFDVSVTVAFAVTWAAGTGVTLAGRTTTAASSATRIYITKDSATAVTWNVV